MRPEPSTFGPAVEEETSTPPVPSASLFLEAVSKAVYPLGDKAIWPIPFGGFTRSFLART